MRLLVAILVAVLTVLGPVDAHKGNKHNAERSGKYAKGFGGHGHRQAPRNLIYLISDGYGVGAQTMTREVMEALSIGEMFADKIAVGRARTKSGDALVTDSASSATSLSCGIKTYRGAIGLDLDGNPCRTVMEAAVDEGFKTGIIATSRLSDATPASFNSHAQDRSLLELIALQQVYSDVDIMLGGGRDVVSDREDGRDLYREANLVLNYTTVDTAPLFRAANSLPMLGLFTQSHMSQEIDRNPQEEPSLLEMTTKALDLLAAAAKEENTGFFLFIEGSNIDKRFHEMDSIGATFDAIEFDHVIQQVTEFAERDGNTLVMATSDHETRACSLGNIEEKSLQTWFPERFGQVSASCLQMARRYLVGESVESVLHATTSFVDFPFEAEEIAQMERDLVGASEFTASEVFSAAVNRRLNVGYGSLDHSAEDVMVFAYGPGANLVEPVVDNTELPKIVADLFGWKIGSEAGIEQFKTKAFQDKFAKMGYTSSALKSHPDEIASHRTL